jgi:hypothetical protein
MQAVVVATLPSNTEDVHAVGDLPRPIISLTTV